MTRVEADGAAARSRQGYFAKSALDVATVDAMVAWLVRDVLGAPAAGWFHAVVEAAEIRSARHLLDVLAVKWPGLILTNDRSASMAWLSTVVCEDFLLDAPARLFPQLAYQTLLDRQPTKDEQKAAADIVAVEDRRRLLAQIVASEAYRRATGRRTLLGSAGRNAEVAFELRHNEYQTLFYRRPDAMPSELFTVGGDTVPSAASPVKGCICARFDRASGRLVVDPNVSIVGKSLGGNLLRFGRDFVVLGPRITLPPGRYLVVADLACRGGGEMILDMVSGLGGKSLMSVTFRESLKTVIPVSLAEAESAVELRLISTGAEGGELALNDLGIFFDQTGERGAPVALPVAGKAAPGKPRRRASLAGLRKLFRAARADDGKTALYRFVAACGEFDGDWYLRRYDDVRAAGVDPLGHFLEHGMAEGRVPNETFDPIGWASRHPGATPETAFVAYLRDTHPALADEHLDD